MIVTIRGTNGSGKSTAVRAWLRSQRSRGLSHLMLPGRRKPAGLIVGPEEECPVMVLGHYDESATNGGFDTFDSIDQGYGLVEVWAKGGGRVLYEGKAHAADVQRAVGLGAHILYLTTPLSTCLSSVARKGLKPAKAGGACVVTRVYNRQIKERKMLDETDVAYELLTRSKIVARLKELLA